MKNVQKIVLSLSLVVGMVAGRLLHANNETAVGNEQADGKVSFNQALHGAVQTATNAASAVKNVGQASVQAGVDLTKATGKAADGFLMTIPYGVGYACRTIGYALKGVAGYTIGFVPRWVGYGIDGMFGPGTVESMGAVAKGGLQLTVAGATLAALYKSLNFTAKYFGIQSIKNVFEKGGSLDGMEKGIVLCQYNDKKYNNVSEFYKALADDLKKRFEYTDLCKHIGDIGNGYIKFKSVYDFIDENVSGALNYEDNSCCSVEEIVSKSRQKSAGIFGRLGKVHLLSGYCKEALELYTKIIIAQKMAEKNTQLTHQNIIGKINENKISKKLLEVVKNP